MNKIVLEHYPASKLPQELRKGIADGASVRVTIEEELRPLTRKEFLASLKEARRNAKGVTIEEAVARVRELRDEWED
jgi:lipoate-protein ligase A